MWVNELKKKNIERKWKTYTIQDRMVTLKRDRNTGVAENFGRIDVRRVSFDLARERMIH